MACETIPPALRLCQYPKGPFAVGHSPDAPGRWVLSERQHANSTTEVTEYYIGTTQTFAEPGPGTGLPTTPGTHWVRPRCAG